MSKVGGGGFIELLKTWMPIVGFPALALIYSLYNANIDLRFTILEAKAAVTEQFMKTQQDKDALIQAKIAVLEDAMSKGRDDRLRWQAETSAQIKEIRQGILELNKNK